MISADMLGLSGKTAIVWGGGFGMGERTAHRLSEAGANVAVVDLVHARAVTVAGDITAAGGRATAVHADVTSEASVDAALAAAEAALGPVDVMATVIGVGVWGQLLDMSLADFERSLEINLTSFFIPARAVARSLIQGGRPGAIACVSSVSGLTAAPGHGGYGAAKAGLDAYVRYLAEETADVPGITAFSFVPGLTDTAMQAGLRAVSAEQFPQVDQFRRWHDRGVAKQPALVAEALELALALPHDELHGSIVEADQLLKRR